jgi:hypothetical protein
MTTGTRGTFQNAIDKAAALGTHKTVRELAPGRYAVSGTAAVYTVTVDAAGEYECSCRAGQLGRPCYHQGGVWLARLRDQAAGVIPAAAPATVARESDADARVRLLAESRERARHIEELEGSLADCFTAAA